MIKQSDIDAKLLQNAIDSMKEMAESEECPKLLVCDAAGGRVVDDEKEYVENTRQEIQSIRKELNSSVLKDME